MKSPIFSNDVVAAASVHLNILDEFIATVQKKMDETVNPFVRDSLVDLLANLRDQREGYSLFAAPATTSVAASSIAAV
ncbi:hypothetical protein [Azospirillum rugosum]|uniref:Uncharacterized protein n=1 Tax=Azospirillum rugosum TaxID=416170 RepID=A0ABS4SJG9_9PROT|nr:hypothetical protein [Azospirillum rugosum]MBP2292647.1 hypothetical protein [Azospirillum rugosum]MDQ0526329.1 hypothetical protein [Azospirillum rugosum]